MSSKKMLKKSILFAPLYAGAAAAGTAAPGKTIGSFTLEIYLAQDSSVSPACSKLVSGQRDAILIDAQFLRNEAEQLAEKIRASGKRLTGIYISRPEPECYFGLGVLKAAFPEARILASTDTVDAIRKQAGAKVAYWGAILKHNAPRCIVIPQSLAGDMLTLEGETLHLRDVDGTLLAPAAGG